MALSESLSRELRLCCAAAAVRATRGVTRTSEDVRRGAEFKRGRQKEEAGCYMNDW